jgi:hypothetical protein
MYDGDMWSEKDLKAAEEISIDPITVNRIFPTVELLKGSQMTNRLNIIAKGRTQRDTELGNLISEGIQFVIDQNGGQEIISDAFAKSIVPGINYIQVGLNHDPRREPIQLKLRDWKTVWTDPFGDPWLDPTVTRYLFFARWMDLETLKAAFPAMKKEIEEQFNEFAGDTGGDTTSFYMDEATEIEMDRRSMSSAAWIKTDRQRCRPVEIWFPVYEPGIFAIFKDGRVVEITECMEPAEQLFMVENAQRIVRAMVQKMWWSVLFGNVELARCRSQLGHDRFPVSPFIGYLDRFNLPYGVPRQIRGQNIEVNKRRSMALAMLYKRRITAENDVVDTPEELDELFVEANKLDGFMRVKPGALNRIRTEDHLAKLGAQLELMQLSEKEISEISGANNEMMGYGSNARSGTAIEARQSQGATITAPLFSHLRRSLKTLGELVTSEIQEFWTEEKVLRITDDLTGVDKFVVLNQKTPDGRIQNNITEGTYDVIISESPRSDTIREQNVNLLTEWMKKAPPEVLPYLFLLSLEMSGVPNKDKILARMQPVLGIEPGTENMTAEELRQYAVEKAQAASEAAQHQAQLAEQELIIKMESDQASTRDDLASAQKKLEEVKKIQAETAKLLEELKQLQFQTGFAMGQQSVDEMARKSDALRTAAVMGAASNEPNS